MINEQTGLAEHKSLQFVVTNAGMDFDSRPVELGTSKWRYAFNVERRPYLVSVPRKSKYLTTYSDILFVGSIPKANFSVWLIATKTAIRTFYVDFSTGTGEFFNLPGGKAILDNRISVCAYNNVFYLIGERTPLMATDGTKLLSLGQHRVCELVPNEFDFQGNGPFTKARTHDEHGNIVGDLGPVAHMSQGQSYRVYCKNPKLFKLNWRVSAGWFSKSYSMETLTGKVVGVYPNYILVKAAYNTSLPNVKSREIGFVETLDINPPRGRYVRAFFDHLFVGAPPHAPNKLIWSHLRDFAEWEADTTNEADSYTFTENQSTNDVVEGITGLEVWNDKLIVFTSSAIYMLDYVGLPNVVRVSTLSTDSGCGFKYGTTVADGMVYWCDTTHADFRRLGPNGIESIGQGIRNFFFSDIELDPIYRQNLVCFNDRYKNEVVWAYTSWGATKNNRMVVFNYQYNEWSVRQCENISAVATLQLCAKPILKFDDVAIADLPGTVGDLGVLQFSIGKVFAVDNHLAVEATEAASQTELLPYEPAVLETGDIVFESADTVKEIDSIVLSANKPVYVDISARQNLDSPVVFQYVGTWTPNMPTLNRLTFPAVSGHVFRFRFRLPEPKTTLSLIEPYGFSIGADR